MKLLAFLVVVLIWMAISSIPRGPDKKDTYSWVNRTTPTVLTKQSVSEELKNEKAQSPREPVHQIESKIVHESSSRPEGLQQLITCQKSGVSERFLIMVKRHQGCDLSYIKSGKSELVARSQFSHKPCEQAHTKISNHLKLGGFHCKETSE